MFLWNLLFFSNKTWSHTKDRSSHQRCSVIKGRHKNFATFTGKHLFVLESLFNKVCNFIKKRLKHKCFPLNIAKFLRTPTLKNICERLLLKGSKNFPHMLNGWSTKELSLIPFKVSFLVHTNQSMWYLTLCAIWYYLYNLTATLLKVTLLHGCFPRF